MAQKTKNLNLPPKSRKIYSDINAGSASTSRDDSQTSFHFETLTEDEKIDINPQYIVKDLAPHIKNDFPDVVLSNIGSGKLNLDDKFTALLKYSMNKKSKTSEFFYSFCKDKYFSQFLKLVNSDIEWSHPLISISSSVKSKSTFIKSNVLNAAISLRGLRFCLILDLIIFLITRKY